MDKPDLIMGGIQELMDQASKGKVKPVVGQTFRLDEASKAHRFMEGRKSYGKIVLEP